MNTGELESRVPVTPEQQECITMLTLVQQAVRHVGTI